MRTSMTVAAYNCFPGRHKTLLRQKGMTDAMTPNIVKLSNALSLCPAANSSHHFRRLDVFIRYEVVRHNNDARRIEDFGNGVFFQQFNRRCGSNIVTHYRINFAINQFTRLDKFTAAMRC